MPAREIRRMYCRSAMMRRSATMIDPLRKELPKSNKFDYLNIPDEIGFTALQRSILTKNFKNTRWIVSKGVDVNIISPTCGMSALHFAARHGDTVSVQVLLTVQQCDLNIQDKDGWTALHHCAINNHQYIAEMLLASFAAPDISSRSGMLPYDLATTSQMRSLFKAAIGDKKTPSPLEKPIMECIEIPRKGADVTRDSLGLRLEVPRLAICQELFFICKRKSPAQCKINLGESEMLISDVYEFWPPDLSFLAPIIITVTCLPTNESDEVILKLDGEEVPIYNEKQPSMFGSSHISRKTLLLHHNNRTQSSQDPRKRIFALTKLGRMYVVSRLTKETSSVLLTGATIRHSADDRFSVSVPKNGLSSDCKIALQLYPVEYDMISALKKQHSDILSIGPVCEVSHNDSEPLSRRLITMTVPPPISMERGGHYEGKLVVVSGTCEMEENEIEIVEKCLLNEGAVELLTRYLSWKVAVLVRSTNKALLADVCESVRTYTCKRMQFVSVTLAVSSMHNSHNRVDVMTSISKSGVQCRLPQAYAEVATSSSIMMYEGEILTICCAGRTETITFFSKQSSQRTISIECPSTKILDLRVFRMNDISKTILDTKFTV